MIQELILLCLAAFAAGFIDAIVGGGGLLQTPATLLILPHYPVAPTMASIKPAANAAKQRRINSWIIN
ncbi:MAG TPA: hypothetical protein VL088_03225, partial [Pedobacter sp.]|nr:hypothetical protein [Pedobacter sp.]